MHQFATGSLVAWKIPGPNVATGLVLDFERHMFGTGAWVMWSDRHEPMWALLQSLIPSDKENN